MEYEGERSGLRRRMVYTPKGGHVGLLLIGFGELNEPYVPVGNRNVPLKRKKGNSNRNFVTLSDADAKLLSLYAKPV